VPDRRGRKVVVSLIERDLAVAPRRPGERRRVWLAEVPERYRNDASYLRRRFKGRPNSATRPREVQCWRCGTWNEC
jgi:hypothetical protein